MTFSLVFFVVFSILAIFIYHIFIRRYINVFLLVVSAIFYLWIDYRHFGLLYLSIIVTYYLTEIAKKADLKKRRVVAWIAIGVVIFLLVIYKNIGKIVNNFDFTIDVFVPIGLSYFSFKMISYIVDIGLKAKKNEKYSLAEYALYVSFFSQIVSGPITRIEEFEFGSSYNKITKEEIIENMRLIVSGVFKKIVIAERLAVYTEYCFSNYSMLPTIALWINMCFFSIQIYCDFCGYSEIAIGITRMFGLKCSNNFNYPYFSKTIKEFWNCWHISLSRWLCEYIYIPLGGNRSGVWKKIRNTLVVFGVSGIWHGSSWNYLIWGIWHAVFLILTPRNCFIRNKIGKFVCYIGTLFVVSIGWLFFYYTNIKNTFFYLGNMFHRSDFSVNSIIMSVMPFTHDYACFAHLGIVLVMIFILFAYELFNYRKKRYNCRLEINIYLVSIVLFGIFGQNNFIYANF